MTDLTDSRTLAYINMYAVFGTLENLCELDATASALVSNIKPISIGIDVAGGPKATLYFKNGRCRLEQGCYADCDVKLPFSSCEKFNGLFDGTVTPIPTKGFRHINFLLKTFTALTDRLTALMRPTPEDLEDREFFETSTRLTFYTIAVALAQIANNDDLGKFSAHLIPDGEIAFGIKDDVSATIVCKNHHLVTIKKKCEHPRAAMTFESIDLAKQLFDGKVNAVACIGEGSIEMRGMINMIDNLNRILDRVALYLA